MKKRFSVALVVAGGLALATFAEEPTVGSITETGDVYLQGTGSSCINTDYCIGPKTRVILDFEFGGLATSGSYTAYIMGFHSSTSGRTAEEIYVQTDDYHIRARDNGNWGGFTTHGQNTRYTLDYDVPYKVLRAYDCSMSKLFSGSPCSVGERSMTFKGTTDTSTVPLQIFSFRHSNGNWAGGMPWLRVYGCRIYESNVLVRDFVPYGYGAVTGLVERLSGKVYTDIRKSKTPFTIGCEPGSARSNADTYLNTGYYLNPKTKLEVEFSFDWNSADKCLMGCAAAEGANFGLYRDSNGYLSRALGEGSDGAPWAPFSTAVPKWGSGRRYTYTLDLAGLTETLTARGKALYSGAVTNAPKTAAKVPLALYCLASNTNLAATAITLSRFSHASIYSCKIWDDGTLVRDYVPRTVDNTTGLYDKQNGTFLTATTTTTRIFQLRTGGKIETAAKGGTLAANGDAYLLATRSSGDLGSLIKTDYYLKPTSRLVMDFAWYLPWGTEYIFGNAAHIGVYGQINGSGRPFLNCVYAGAWGGGGSSGTTQGSEFRMTCVTDLPKKKITFTNVDESSPHLTYTIKDEAATSTSSVPLSFFGRMTTKGGADSYAAARLYSAKIYENDVLVRDYLPAQKGGVAGLMERLSGTFITKNVGTAGSYGIHGAGTGGSGPAFATHPADTALEVGGSAKLTAFAPGALFYQWFRNGVQVEGECGNELTVTWRKGTPRQDAYRCVAFFSTWGAAESNVATVSYARKSLFILVK